MAGPLVETKLRLPRQRRTQVPRPRLTRRLSRAVESPLTLVSAPAGFGKTTVLGEWLTDPAREAVPAAWLSLDDGDNDPGLFWSYVIAALRTIADAVGTTALSLLESLQPSTEAVLTALVNDLDALPGEVVLVLDDYHVIEDRRVRQEVGFFLEHLPHNVHLVIASRADPTLPLARLRARGDLVEIRAADLRFTAEESRDYLIQRMGLGLTERDVAALDERTEGWIAALQLSALSMQGRDDAGQFIAGFAGDDRYIVDYLAEEVLQRQPDQVRTFLLQTSILDRLSAPLCDAVTGRSDSEGMLRALERGNLFLTPQDDRREWYRYHQLFAGVLRANLLQESPGLVTGLHSRASAWWAGNRRPSEAIRHAVAARDLARAADLAELAVPDLSRDRREAEIRGWLRLLPADLVATRPVLNLGFVGALMSVGEFDDVEGRLNDVERVLRDGAADVVVVDEDQFRHLPGMLEMYQAAVALARGDVAGTTAHARAAIGRAAEDDHMCRAGSAALLGLASWSAGDLDAAYSAYAEGMTGLERAGFASDVVGGAVTLADIRIDQGRLGDALGIYERALARAHADGRTLRGVVDVYVGLSEIHCERDDLDTARELLGQATSLGEHMGLPKSPARRRRALARVRLAEGRPDDAVRLLDEAERVYQADFSPDVRSVAALRARVRLAQGRLDDALRWAQQQRLSVDDDLSYLREFDHITFAQVLVARHHQDRDVRPLSDAARLLRRLLPAAELGGRPGRVIEILTLQALASEARGDRSAALTALRRAVTVAEPEGYVRLFVEHGNPIRPLLRALAREPSAPGHVHRLLAAATTTEPVRGQMQHLVDPLSERELDVLRLLATELDGPDIARRMVVSLNTVRTHTKSIYAKLGVNSRRAAVRRAQELRLLSGTGAG